MTARERVEASKSARERGHPAGCACRGTGLVPASGFASGYAPCRALPVEASEIASLRAEVARLTEESAERLKALATATEIAREFDRRYLASRALADRLAEALRDQEWSSPGGDGDGFCPACGRGTPSRDAFGVIVGGHGADCRARAALREWEDAAPRCEECGGSGHMSPPAHPWPCLACGGTGRSTTGGGK